MKALKNFLSIVLALAIMFTAVPVAFTASTETEGYFSYSVSNDKAALTRCDTAVSGDIVIWSTLGGYPVTSLGNSAFSGCDALTSITIPDSVTAICDGAFYGCTSLTDVYYIGTEEQWNNISIGSDNDCLINAIRHYNYICEVHTWDGGTVTAPATCTAEGAKTFTCTVCGATKTETIAKSAHTYKNVVTAATTSKDGKTESKCSVCGNVSKTTTIYAAKSVTLSKTAYTYTGKAIKPAVTVKDSKGNVIDSKYYTVKYTNNKNVGKATVTVTLKGNYSGTLSATFKINPKATTLSSVTANSKGFTAKWKKQSTQTTGYQIQYSTSKKFTSKTTKTVTVKDAKTLTKTISKLKASTKYYVRVRTYKTVSKTNYYSSWSKAKTVTTKKAYKTTSKGYKIEQKNGFTYVDGLLIANKTYSLPPSFDPGGLTAECNKAFINMRSAASEDGVNLYIVSGYRSYSTQNRLYNSYVARDGRAKADTYSARPGTSEHQTGLAMDLNSLSTSFGQTKEGKWLAANCHKYGFIIRYPKGKQNVTGYIYEPWHVRYVGVEKATKIYESGLCLEEYYGITSKYAD